MTMPAEPATGDPAPETGDPSQQPTTPPTDDPGQPATGDDWGSLFEGLTPQQVKEKLDHARRWENRAKSNKAKLDELQAKAPQPDEGGEDWQAKYQSELERAEAAEARAVEMTYKDAVRSAAATAGADAKALLDSQSFRDEVSDLLDDDFDDDDLAEVVAKVTAKFAKEARFAAGPTGATRSGADIGGGPGGARQITEAELARMTPEQIVDAQNKGLLAGLL